MVETVHILRMAQGNEGVAKLSDGKTVFVKNAAPGDTVSIEITEDKGNFARASIFEVVEASELRVKPQCPYFEACGGCEWQHLSYEGQLAQKRDAVLGALTHAGSFAQERAEELVRPTLGSKRQWGYRNKIELSCSRDSQGHLQLGFYQEGTNTPLKVAQCPVAQRAIEKAPKALSGALKVALGSDDTGLFRVGVRNSLRTGDTEIALWTTPGPFPRDRVANILSTALKNTSVVRVLAEEGKARKVKKVELLSGKGCWEESLADSRYLTSAPAFFQVNTAQAENLVRIALQELGDIDGAYVADLYSGGGTFSIPLAKAGADVVAVEYAGPSVRDLRRNAERNDVFVDVVGGDAARELPELGDLDALVVDPPRSGLAKGVPESIAAAGPEKLVYVSCNPQTWARDTKKLEECGYQLTAAHPVDMFPQTHHVEVVSAFTKR